MKRFVFAFLTLFAILSLVPTAEAAWVQKEIFWRKSSVRGTSIWVRDTTHTVLAGEVADTTGEFSIKEADIWFNHPGAATTVDTVYFAYIVLQADSSVRGTESITSVTVEVDGRAIGAGPTIALDNWQQVDSTVVTFVDSDPLNRVLAIPLRAISGLGGLGSNGPENALNYFYRIMAFETLRVRFSAATGILSGGVRAYLRYFDQDY